MEGVQAVEGELNAVVKEYLQMLDYTKSVQTFESEANENGKQIILDALPPSQDENQMHVQKKILQAYENGNNQVFTRLWSENIPEELQEDSSCKRLEFNSQLYFATYPIAQGTTDQNKIDKAMKTFKSFLETRGAALSQTTEFVTFYALPFVPASSLKNHPSFSILFQESWSEDLKQKLEDFLSTVLYAAPLPYLYKLFTGSGDRSRTEHQQYENHIQALQQQISEHEHRATVYFKRYTKIQADYKNLINIAAELVDSLENAVRGNMVTPEYLRSICERLFSSAQHPMQSTDFARPGTAASLLRASVANASTGVAIGNDVPYLPSLNYAKIKEDLRRLSLRKRALLLQALRLRLMRSQSGEQRDAVLSAYIANDILGCASDIKHGETMANLLNSKEELVQSQAAMLFNTIASFTTGRVYIGQSEPMMKELISCLKQESERTKAGENLLGAMQKLSLRRQVQSIMIQCGFVDWLIKVLEEPELLTDYSLEYSVALLMNLCLRSAGKRQCLADCETVLQLLADLLGNENKEIRPYVNGTLYSILALPTVRQRAVSMGLEEVLRCYMQEDEPDMNRQIQFIIKQMNTNDRSSSDDPHSDNEEDEDDDEEGDVLDAELEEDEVEIAKSGELSGEQLLSAHYLGVLSSISMSATFDAKAFANNSSSDREMPLTRPVTPRAHPKLSAIEEVASRETVRSGLHSQSGRPKTQSSGTSSRKNVRESPSTEMPPPRSRPTPNQGSQSKKLDPFQSNQRIPRTPDSKGSNRSRPLTGDVPLPTRSVSPPVPKPSSRGQDAGRCFQDCIKPCRSMKKRHFHCKICDYISDRLDNMKRHIPYHFLTTKKERQRAPDGIKMIGHEYFTENCSDKNCNYGNKKYTHFHCTLCKTWGCNGKKNYKYRLKHLNNAHDMVFGEDETPNVAVERKRRKISSKGSKAQKIATTKTLLPFPAAKEEVLNARRRAKYRPRVQANETLSGIKTEKADAREIPLTIEYLDSISQNVKRIMQPIDDGSAENLTNESEIFDSVTVATEPTGNASTPFEKSEFASTSLQYSEHEGMTGTSNAACEPSECASGQLENLHDEALLQESSESMVVGSQQPWQKNGMDISDERDIFSLSTATDKKGFLDQLAAIIGDSSWVAIRGEEKQGGNNQGSVDERSDDFQNSIEEQMNKNYKSKRNEHTNQNNLTTCSHPFLESTRANRVNENVHRNIGTGSSDDERSEISRTPTDEGCSEIFDINLLNKRAVLEKSFTRGRSWSDSASVQENCIESNKILDFLSRMLVNVVEENKARELQLEVVGPQSQADHDNVSGETLTCVSNEAPEVLACVQTLLIP